MDEPTKEKINQAISAREQRGYFCNDESDIVLAAYRAQEREIEALRNRIQETIKILNDSRQQWDPIGINHLARERLGDRGRPELTDLWQWIGQSVALLNRVAGLSSWHSTDDMVHDADELTVAVREFLKKPLALAPGKEKP